MVGTWKSIADYVEPSWDKVGGILPLLFWRKRIGAAFGYIRDGELFDARWVYVCEASRVTHYSEINAPLENTIEWDALRMRDDESHGSGVVGAREALAGQATRT